MSRTDVETGPGYDQVRQLANELSTRGIHYERANWIDSPTVILEKRELNSCTYTTIMLHAYKNGSIKAVVLCGHDSQPLGGAVSTWVISSQYYWDLQELGLFDSGK